ncbi:hypothetical protein [Paenibacillus terrae]|uniref:hypothetical protein n=1 Tax=Paenibacillus terrae TaxID=159743 RepID=UPI0013791EED|nr:hypothetical protein [Paenibacillus terrae]
MSGSKHESSCDEDCTCGSGRGKLVVPGDVRGDIDPQMLVNKYICMKEKNPFIGVFLS